MILTDADFLPAILAHPFDDAPRLVYAEWLEDRAHESGGGERCETCDGKGWGDDDNGDEWRCLKCRGTGRIPDTRVARAEFIRVQIDLANSRHGGISREQFKTLKNRETELLSKMEFIFVGDIPILWNDLRRGFVASISCTLAAFMQHAAEIFSRHPVTKVRLTDRRPTRGTLHRYGWYGKCSMYSADDLPLALFNCLKDHTDIPRYPSFWRWYTSLEAAQLALSHACVDYGRQLVGLPPLNRPPETEETGTTA